MSDRKILLGMGIGIVLSTIIMVCVKINVNLSKNQIENRARAIGMEYPNEMKVINKKP